MTDARSEPAGELLPGTSYRLIKRLGGGGMGSVYIAEHTALGRRDAVKLLAPHIAEDEQAMKRLEREARATAALANPHIIDIYTLGVTTDNRPYVAMRLIQGQSLKELIERERKLDVDRAWALLRQVCLALQSAHEAGIVHRDLKPENLMVEPRDAGEFVTILDFGIAKVEAETEARLTQDGQVIGTPGYMAPEQALGRAVDGRADQYSIAAIFYELVSGAFPYDRLGALQTITQQITQDPKPLSQHVGDQAVPPALQRLIMRCLSRDPADRLPGLDAFVRIADEALGFVPAVSRSRLTLEAVRAAPAASPSAPAPAPAARRSGPLVIVGVGAVAGAAIAA
ncbi:serine/threonine protein kinase, partial [Myxococcota bacterium]|nr:serine/threonine protein kinase [Myxococcota bacterium]